MGPGKRKGPHQRTYRLATRVTTLDAQPCIQNQLLLDKGNILEITFQGCASVCGHSVRDIESWRYAKANRPGEFEKIDSWIPRESSHSALNKISQRVTNEVMPRLCAGALHLFCEGSERNLLAT